MGIHFLANQDKIVGVYWFLCLEVKHLCSTKYFDFVLINFLAAFGIVNVDCESQVFIGVEHILLEFASVLAAARAHESHRLDLAFHFDFLVEEGRRKLRRNDGDALLLEHVLHLLRGHAFLDGLHDAILGGLDRRNQVVPNLESVQDLRFLRIRTVKA